MCMENYFRLIRFAFVSFSSFVEDFSFLVRIDCWVSRGRRRNTPCIWNRITLLRRVIITWNPAHFFGLRIGSRIWNWSRSANSVGDIIWVLAVIDICTCRQISLLDRSLCIFGWFWGVSHEFLDNWLIIDLGLQSDSSLFALQALNLDFFG